MPTYRTEAVVLKLMDFGESDRIVTFFSRDFGKIRGIAKSSKKSQKRFGASLEPFTLGELDFFYRSQLTLRRINRFQVSEPLIGLWRNWRRMVYAAYLLQLVDAFLPDEMKNERVFALLTFFLRLINSQRPEEGLLRIFEIRLLNLVGFRPHLSSCLICGREWDPSRIVEFSSVRGGIVCPECRPTAPERLSLHPGTRQFLEKALTLAPEHVSRLHFTVQANLESRRLLQEFIRYQLGKDLSAMRVLAQCL